MVIPPTFLWILLSTFLMALIAWVGILTFFLREESLRKILLLLVAFSAGSLLGGAFLHLIPKTIEESGGGIDIFLWVLIGFCLFFLMEQFLNWHHCHRVPSEHKKPVTYLVLLADGVHNFTGGLAIGGSFLVSVPTGVITWIACAAHEIPQEFGDFGILLHGGWNKLRALWFNFFSALTIIPGGILAYFLSTTTDTTFLLPFAAGNFIYISSSDLIPEIKHGESLKRAILHFIAFISGVLLLVAIKFAFGS